MAKKIIQVKVDGGQIVEVTMVQTKEQGFACTDVTGDYTNAQLNIIYLTLNDNEAVLENLWNYDIEDDIPEAYLNLAKLTTKKIEDEANEILAGTGLKAYVFETSEEYEATDISDALYDGLPMFEGYLVHEASEDDLEDTTTGRYCNLQSVREEILATAQAYSKLTIGVMREEDSDRVRYMAVGKVEDDQFTGIVYAYSFFHRHI